MSGYDLRCFICRRRKATQLEHCHTCGMYRGWLCNRCNSNISGDQVGGSLAGWCRVRGGHLEYVGRDPLRERAKSYLEKHFAVCVKPPFPVRRIRWDSIWRQRAQRAQGNAEFWLRRCNWLEHRFGHPYIDWERKRILKRPPKNAVPCGRCEWCRKERY